MKSLLIALFLICTNSLFAQWCNKPNPAFCPGNYFQNGDFETITGNPSAVVDQDINLATGWQAMWAAGSLADLFCTGGANGLGVAPTPNSNVYAGIWIENRPTASGNAVYREGMYNRLNIPIAQNTGTYSFNFKIANAQLNNTNPANPIQIGIYGVYNPTNVLAAAPTGLNFNPSNVNLWASVSSTVQVVLLQTITPPSTFSNTWLSQTVTFNSNILPALGITHIMISANDLYRPPVTGKLYVNFDEFCLQRAEPESKFCCPGKNLVVNGDFEGGNVGINTTDYAYNASVATGATIPGQYNIVTGTQALAINRCWVAQDPSTCNNTSGKFLAVNGRTCGGKKVVWQKTFTVNDWTCYEFCASVKELKECVCDFDVKPKIEVEFSMSGIGNITQVVNVGPGACNWFNIRKQVCLWGYGSSLTIKILLDESVAGDGNDLALDNIALIAIPNCPPPVFNITTAPATGTYYNITATNTPTVNCPATWWEVCEYDMSSSTCIAGSIVTNLPVWWFPSTCFPTYNGIAPYAPVSDPCGRFAYGKLYRITLGTWGDCHGWGAFTRYVGSSLKTKKVQVFTEEDVKKNAQTVLKALK